MVTLMIEKVFNEIKNEARLGEVILKDNGVDLPIRIAFNIVDDKEYNNIPNIYIKDKDNFSEILKKYVFTVLEFYDLIPNYNNIKEILTYALVNITEDEMTSLDDYFLKYIEFYNQRITNDKGVRKLNIGNLKYGIEKQSMKQETPYCFKSYLERDNSKYSLPRISFGINDDICYIYAIQNKDSKINNDPKYNLEVKNTLNKINSGVSKYRNVTPSFVVALVLFISFLEENNINKIIVETPLPIRKANREASLNQRIKFYSMQGNLKGVELEKFKKEIIDKKIMDDYNSTVKFVNCFNRLKLHFDNLFISNINNKLILDIINLSTNNSFLNEIIKEKEIDNNGKISKHSSC